MKETLRPAQVLARLNALGHAQKLEALSERWGLPFIAEYELSFFRRLRHPELQLLSARLEGQRGALARAVRGRLLRLLGDGAGAAEELRRALDLEPGLALGHLWLAELDLRTHSAERSLSRALELDGKLGEAYLYRGAHHLWAGKLKEARADLQRCRELAKGSFLGLILGGRVEEKSGRRAAAARFYQAAAKLDPVCAAAFLLWSRAESNSARSARACEKAMDADPTYALITLSRFKAGRDWGSYLKWMRGFAFSEPERAGWYYRQEDIHYSPYQFQEFADSMRLHQARPGAAWAAGLVGRGVLRCPPDPGRARQGVDCLEKAVRWSPKSGWIYAWRALGWIKSGQPEKALEDFALSIRLQPYYHRAYAWRGALLRKRGRAQEALADLDRAVAIDEQYAFAAHERSLALRDLDDFPGAVLEMDRAFKMDFRYSWVFTVGREATPAELGKAISGLDAALLRHPHQASLRVWRGQLRLQQRDFSAAFLDFEEAQHADPHLALAWAWQGRGLIDSGHPAAALSRLKKSVELEPALWIYRGWLAEAEAKAGRSAEALARLNGILAAKPKTWWVYHLRAQIYLQLGRPKKALADIEESVGYEGRHADGWYITAQARLALGDLPGALDAIEKTLVISPNMGRAYILRARVRESLGRFDEVLSDYRTVYEKFPYLFNEEERGRVKALLSA